MTCLRVGALSRALLSSLLSSLLCLLALSPCVFADEPPKPAPGAFEVRFVDDSSMKLTLLKDQKIDLVTPYGKLAIPVLEIQRIHFGLHITDEQAKKIDTLIAELGSSEFRRREEAATELLTFQEKALPALQQAVGRTDPEVQRRAEELVEKLRETVPTERLELPIYDVVHTENSKIAGRITTASLKAATFQFGEQPLKIADIRSLRSLAVEPEMPVVVALPDPGTLRQMENPTLFGKSFYFRVTGAAQGTGALWGSDVYTTDSSLAMAAVHAGALRPGQSGVVKVTILGQQPAYVGSTRNGITSGGYASYVGFRICK
jgi:hypothetical protein